MTQPWRIYPGPSLRPDHQHRLWHLRPKILINNKALLLQIQMILRCVTMTLGFTSQERTVHTIHFKIWSPDSPHHSLSIQEINQYGYIKQFEPEFFFLKLTGDQTLANRLADYWRQFNGIPVFQQPIRDHLSWLMFLNLFHLRKYLLCRSLAWLLNY